MARGDLKKPSQNRNYVKSDSELGYSESDHEFKVEASMASEDYSVQGDAELSDAELLKRYRVSMTSNIMPTLPAIEGFHLCWVPQTSNNHYDTVDFRKQVGYAVVKPEEVPGFMSMSNRSGQIEGCVSHNELILMKIPQRLYQMWMKESHHTQPNEQEKSIQQAIKQMQYKDGQSLVRDEHEMDGINKLARKVKDPIFN